MRALLVLVTLIDFGLAVLLGAMSGSLLVGVKGAMMPEAILLGLMTVGCIVAPALAWWLRSRGFANGVVLAIAAMPLLIAVPAALV